MARASVTVYRVGPDGAVQMILGGKIVTVPASTLSSVDGRLVTSLQQEPGSGSVVIPVPGMRRGPRATVRFTARISPLHTRSACTIIKAPCVGGGG